MPTVLCPLYTLLQGVIGTVAMLLLCPIKSYLEHTPLSVHLYNYSESKYTQYYFLPLYAMYYVPSLYTQTIIILTILCPLLLYAHSTPFYKPTMSSIHSYLLYYVLYTPIPTILCPSIHPYLLYYVLVYTHAYCTMPSVYTHSYHCFLYAPYYHVYYPWLLTLCIIVMK